MAKDTNIERLGLALAENLYGLGEGQNPTARLIEDDFIPIIPTKERTAQEPTSSQTDIPPVRY